jgi:hypothetical protein
MDRHRPSPLAAVGYRSPPSRLTHQSSSPDPLPVPSADPARASKPDSGIESAMCSHPRHRPLMPSSSSPLPSASSRRAARSFISYSHAGLFAKRIGTKVAAAWLPPERAKAVYGLTKKNVLVRENRQASQNGCKTGAQNEGPKPEARCARVCPVRLNTSRRRRCPPPYPRSTKGKGIDEVARAGRSCLSLRALLSPVAASRRRWGLGEWTKTKGRCA